MDRRNFIAAAGAAAVAGVVPGAGAARAGSVGGDAEIAAAEESLKARKSPVECAKLVSQLGPAADQDEQEPPAADPRQRLRARLKELNIRGALTVERRDGQAEALVVWLSRAEDLPKVLAELPAQWDGYELRIHVPTPPKPVADLRVKATTEDWVKLLNAVYLHDGKQMRELFDSRSFDDDPSRGRVAYYMSNDGGVLKRKGGPFVAIRRDPDYVEWFKQEQAGIDKRRRICAEIREAASRLGDGLVRQGFLESSRVEAVSYDHVTDVASVVYQNVVAGEKQPVRVVLAQPPGKLQAWLDTNGRHGDSAVIAREVLSGTA